jgi:hypothetical protein
MEIRFYEDPDTGLPHIFGHGVSEREVRQVLRSCGEDLPGTRNSAADNEGSRDERTKISTGLG